jgi:hypothetical protein
MQRARRSFLFNATGLIFALPVAAVAICAGCEDSVPTTSQTDAGKSNDRQATEREARAKTKEGKKKK